MSGAALISGLAFIAVKSVALIAGLTFVAKRSGCIRGDAFFQQFNFEFNFFFHVLSPPFRSGLLQYMGLFVA